MAPLCGNSRRLQPRRASTRHQYTFGTRCSHPSAVEQLSSGLRMLNARDGIPSKEVPDTCLIACNAGANALDQASFGKRGHLGIAYQSPVHDHGVRQPPGECPLCVLRLVHPSGNERGDAPSKTLNHTAWGTA